MQKSDELTDLSDLRDEFSHLFRRLSRRRWSKPGARERHSLLVRASHIAREAARKVAAEELARSSLPG